MGLKEVRVVRVRKWVTISLLVFVSGALVALVYALSGRAYLRERSPSELLRAHSLDTALASLAPAIANALVLVPWGFLAFLAADVPTRPRRRTYALTLVLALAFSLAVDAWQFTLPTRVSGWLDLPWNLAGAFAGAMLGHARKSVRVQFQ